MERFTKREQLKKTKKKDESSDLSFFFVVVGSNFFIDILFFNFFIHRIHSFGIVNQLPLKQDLPNTVFYLLDGTRIRYLTVLICSI